MSLSDDELKKLREIHGALDPLMRAIIDEALSRGAHGKTAKEIDAEVAERGRVTRQLEGLVRERDEARAALTMADKNFGVIYEGQRAALAKAKQERDAARAVTAEVQGAFGLAKSNARAAVIEECREKAKQMGEWGFADVLTRLHSVAPSGQWVAADVMEQVRNAIEQLAFGLDPEDFARPQDRYAAQLKISEDALKALFPDWNGPAMDEGRSMTRTGSELCAEIEALSSSLPSGHWVAADVMEKVKAALSEHSCDHCPGCEFPHGTSDEGDVAQLRAALSALEASR